MVQEDVVDVFCCINAQNITFKVSVTDLEVKIGKVCMYLCSFILNGNLLGDWEQFINLCFAVLTGDSEISH